MLFLQILAVLTTKRKRKTNPTKKGANPVSKLPRQDEANNDWCVGELMAWQSVWYESFIQKSQEMTDPDEKDMF